MRFSVTTQTSDSEDFEINLREIATHNYDNYT